MSPTLGELMYDLALRALAQQERQVSELRQRMGPLLTAAALTASFFGPVAVDRAGLTTPVVLAGASLGVTLLCGILVLYPRQMMFSIDVEPAYDDVQHTPGDGERMLLRIATGLRDCRLRNGDVVERVAQLLATAAVALGAQIGCWVWAIVVR